MNNLDLSLAPKVGYCLAFLMDDSVILESYKIINECIKINNRSDISIEQMNKCHLFDGKTEYRAMHLNSSDKDVIVVLTEDEEKSIDPLCLKKQIIYLDDDYKIDNKNWIVVINRFNFNEDNCIYLENYRLAGLI